MPDHGEFQNNAVSSSPAASPDSLEEAMWRLKVEDGNQNGLDENHNQYPDRPGAADCIFYLRTGLCGYGSNCRYNHPNYSEQQESQDRGELPERAGQPDCQYFLKTGTCKFGASCKYHHPRDREDARPAPLNVLGLPMRQVEKSCPYYMRTGSCKFGVACKFNHPQPAAVGALYPPIGPSAYGPASSVAPQSSFPLIGGLSTWPMARPYLSSPRMQCLPAYMPVILPPSPGPMAMQQSWNTYMGSVCQVPSTDAIGPTQIPTKFHSQSGSTTAVNLPERPDQPECQYYMKTGGCKYGTTCKYHHPRERYSDSPATIGPLGLPLRPGHDVCNHYSVYGSCRYGTACKFDHPLLGFYNYAVPALCVPDPSALYPANQSTSPQVTWMSATETSVSKTQKYYDHRKRTEEMNNTDASTDISNPPSTQAASIQAHPTPSDSPTDHTD